MAASPGSSEADHADYSFSVCVVPIACGDAVLLPSIEVAFVDRSDGESGSSAGDGGAGSGRRSAVTCHLKTKQRHVSVLPMLARDNNDTVNLERVYTFIDL